jgi:hypothetical protein
MRTKRSKGSNTRKRRHKTKKNMRRQKYRAGNPNIMKYEFLDWIDSDLVQFSYLAENPNAMHMIESHPEFIRAMERGYGGPWTALSENPNAIDIIERHFEYATGWGQLSIILFLYDFTE